MLVVFSASSFEYDRLMKSTIALLQTSPQPAIRSALDEMVSLAEEACSAGARFLATPEYCGGLVSDGPKLVPPHAVEEEHAYLNGVKKFAFEHKVWFLVGSVAITGPDGRIFNRSFLIDDTGQVKSRYTKIHMFDIQLSETEVYRESASVEPGSNAVVMDSPIGIIGHSICYDLRFPALYRDLAKAGAQILAVPAAFTRKTGEVHWHVLNRARAIENSAYVIAPCAVGDVPGGGEAYGHSVVVDPWGAVVADGGTDPCVVLADIDLAECEQARARIPSLAHDRPYSL